MKRVYIIQTWGDHEYLGVRGVFDSRLDAEEHLLGDYHMKDEDGVFENNDPRGNHYTVEEHVVKGES